MLKMFSKVKLELRKCVKCRRFTVRAINPYRKFRLDPPNIPFKYLYLNLLGPYYVNFDKSKNFYYEVSLDINNYEYIIKCLLETETHY